MNRTVKIILGTLGGLILVFFILALVAPKDYKVERSVVINASADLLNDSLKSLRFFTKWDPWSELDPEIKMEYFGEVGAVGSSYKWVGNDQVGEGEMKVLSVSKNKIETEVHFIKPFESTSIAHYIIEPSPEGTKVSWGFSGSNPFPWNAFSLFMNMDEMIGKDFEKGLNKLKTIIESTPVAAAAPAKFEIKEEEQGEKVYVMKRAEVKFQDIAIYFAEHFPKFFEFAGKAKVEPAGAPTGIFFKWDETAMSADMAAAVPVLAKKDLKLDGADTYVQPAGKVLVVNYYGSYEKTADAHYQIDDYMKQNGYEQNGPVYEEYITDPMAEKDTAKWLTKITYPVIKK